VRLHQAAKYFDNSALIDAYLGGIAIYGQFDVYDDGRRDAITVKRRILSMAPDVVIPARRSVTSVDGMTWLLGKGSPDYFNGAAIRTKYIAQAADGLAQVRSFSEVLSSSAGLSAYASVNWDKDTKEIDVSSKLVGMYYLYFSASETISEKAIVGIGTDWFIVRSVYASDGGLHVAITDKLENPVVDAVTVTSQTYNPLTDSTANASVSTSGIRIRWQSQFEYLTVDTETYKRGDLHMVILKSSATPATGGQVVTSDGVKWRVVSVYSEGTCWSLHLRRD